jgi:hypothetical protein
MTKLTKGDFLSILSSKSPQEIEDYIKKNGKIKRVELAHKIKNINNNGGKNNGCKKS